MALYYLGSPHMLRDIAHKTPTRAAARGADAGVVNIRDHITGRGLSGALA
jgi:hypothetical protein